MSMKSMKKQIFSSKGDLKLECQDFFENKNFLVPACNIKEFN